MEGLEQGHMRSLGVGRVSQGRGWVFCHLTLFLAPSMHSVDIFGISEFIFFTFFPAKNRSDSKTEGKYMIAVGSNNHFILGHYCFHKYLYFSFSSNVCPCWSLFFHFWKRHGCKKHLSFLSSSLSRKTTAQEQR